MRHYLQELAQTLWPPFRPRRRVTTGIRVVCDICFQPSATRAFASRPLSTPRSRSLAAPPSRRSARRWTDDRYHGGCWEFDADGLEAGQPYTLSLAGPDKALCEPWTLATFPRRDAHVERCRVLFFACAGGHESLGHLPTSVRNRLLRRALAYQPQAAVANGDHVYWDQRTKRRTRTSPEAHRPLPSRSPESSTVLPRCSAIAMKRF